MLLHWWPRLQHVLSSLFPHDRSRRRHSKTSGPLGRQHLGLLLTGRIPICAEENHQWWYQVSSCGGGIGFFDSQEGKYTHLSTPEADKYDAIKGELTRKFGLTSYERAAAIYRITSLGEAKPSELMDQLLCLLGDNSPDLLFRYHFIQCLPDYVRQTLSSSSEENPRTLVEETDHIFIAGRPRDFVSEAVIPHEATVDRVTRSNKRTQNPKKAKDARFCFYHARFGEKAHHCQQPCSWSGNEAAGQQQ